MNKDGTRFTNSVIYKYASINERLYSLLINNELWFSNPLDFNDPYDCNFNYNYSDFSYDKIYKYLLESKQKNKSDVSDDFLKKRAEYLFTNSNEAEYLGKSFLQEAISKKGITCFSQYDDILLMWSHYANSHDGVCLTFDIERIEFFLKTCIRLITR